MHAVTLACMQFHGEHTDGHYTISILKIPFDKRVTDFWWKNNQYLYDQYEFAQETLNKGVENGYVKEVKERPRHISPLSNHQFNNDGVIQLN